MNEYQEAGLHEIKMGVGGAIAVNLVWWVTTNVFGLQFPFMHFALIFFLLSYLPQLDKKFMISDTDAIILAIRTLANFCLFFSGLLLIGPLGVMFQTSVPTGAIQFLFSSIAVAAILGIARASSFVMMLIGVLFSTT